jgi:GNAT superfamily N-acetyltransferase
MTMAGEVRTIGCAANIRPAASRDARGIAAVLHAAFAPYEPLYTPAAFAATAIPAAGVLRRLEEGPVWVAIEHRRVIGTLGAVLHRPVLHLRGMAVMPSKHGRGIGRRLLAEAERFGRGVGANRIELQTTPFLASALRLYSAAGYEPCVDVTYWLGVPLVTMAKRLANVEASALREAPAETSGEMPPKNDCA